MRIRIKLCTEGLTIPINYKHQLQGLIYHMMGPSSRYHDLHDNGYNVEHKKFKLFTFSDLFGKFEYNDEKKSITFVSNAYFDMTSIDEDLIIDIIDFCNKHFTVMIGNQLISLNGFEILEDQYPINFEMKFSSISPVTCYGFENGNTIYYDPNNEKFKEAIIQNLRRKMEIINHRYDEINIKEIVCIKKRLSHFMNAFIVSYDIEIVFEGICKKVLEIILNTGIGSKNSMGFGMLQYED